MRTIIAILKVILALGFTVILLSADSVREQKYFPKTGDMVFQTISGSKLTNAIAGITQSEYTHCGIVDFQKGKWVVIEAYGKVRVFPMNEWISQGNFKRYAVCRLKPGLDKKIPDLMTEVRKMIGKPYDYGFDTTDAAIYCSELIYKAYKKATGQYIGKTNKLGELNWKPHEKYIRSQCKGKLPLDRELITPKAIAEAGEVEMVFNNIKY
ncbi:MAG TPA: YiiX/YebB-like N1pC/P60 family cysteine hydrolase [Bacteroidales bacterium]|nr:YiiX/YebB-like N1pC/P60 family cysteine hydrolase [Bacteroidales bacterium]